MSEQKKKRRKKWEKTKNLSKQKNRITAKVKLNSFQFIKYAAINSAADRAGNAMNAFIGHNANKLQQPTTTTSSQSFRNCRHDNDHKINNKINVTLSIAGLSSESSGLKWKTNQNQIIEKKRCKDN